MTYLNCYEMVKECRIAVNEYSSEFMAGTDTDGWLLNSHIVHEINGAQRFIYGILMNRVPHWFLEEATLTGVSSVFTLPSDFGRLKKFMNADKFKIFPVGVEDKGAYESNRYYYRKNNTLVINDNGATSSDYTLIYYRKPRDLDFGIAAAGAATSITLASSAKSIADYYNGMTIENITKGWVDTIDDYSAARVCTISETAAASDVYGIVSDIPEEFHMSIVRRAIISIKNSPICPVKASQVEYDIYESELNQALSAFARQSADNDIEDIFEDFDSDMMGCDL